MKNVWFEKEGDNWYRRNRKLLGKKHLDLPLQLIDMYALKPRKVLEIGASNGYRLAAIKEKYKAQVTAVEPSAEAVREGRKLYPFIKFIRSTCDGIKIKSKFDLIIVNYVFHWIYRDKLYECVSKIDSMLEDNGHLLIGDFGQDFFFKKTYKHLKKPNFHTWKMPYWDLFTASGSYLELAKIRYNHDKNKITSEISFDNMGTTVLLKKTDLFLEV